MKAVEIDENAHSLVSCGWETSITALAGEFCFIGDRDYGVSAGIDAIKEESKCHRETKINDGTISLFLALKPLANLKIERGSTF